MSFRQKGIKYSSALEYDLDNYMDNQLQKRRNIKAELATQKYIKEQRRKGTLKWNP